jgi:hypothetical protein
MENKLLNYKCDEILSRKDLTSILMETIEDIPVSVQNILTMLGKEVKFIWQIFTDEFKLTEGSVEHKIIKALSRSVIFLFLPYLAPLILPLKLMSKFWDRLGWSKFDWCVLCQI